MDRVLVFTPDHCTGCGLCELICSLGHTDSCHPERSRIRILRLEERGIIIQTFCQQCEDPACIDACPVSAIDRNEATGALVIDRDECVTCGECISACPFQALQLDETDDAIIACDLCGGDPECVKYCETGSIEFLERSPEVMQKRKDSQKELEGFLDIEKEYR